MKRVVGPLSLVLALLPVVAAGDTAAVRLDLVDEQGGAIAGGLLVFTSIDDPAEKFSIGEGEGGGYEDTVHLPQTGATWKLAQVLVDGYLPVRISVHSEGPDGASVQDVAGMELDPGTPIPPIEIRPGGRVHIELVMGERGEVMQRFLEARRRAAEEAAEEEAAAREPHGAAYATALELYGEGKLEESIAHFRQAAHENPDDPEVLVTYANVLYKAKRFEEFEQAAGRALETDPGNRKLLMMLYGVRRTRGDLPAALQALLALKKLGGGEELLQHFDYVAKKLGRGPQAVPAYEAILDIDPDNVDATVALAMIHAATGNAAESDRYLRRAVELAPHRAPALYLELASRTLAAAEVPAADLDRALALVQKALELEPGLAEAHKLLGLAQWKRQDYAAARAAFEKYLELDPRAPDRDQILDYLDRLSR